MPLLQLKLAQVPNVLGIYGKSGDMFPASASLLHPDAAQAYLKACAQFVRLRVSDMFRTPESSLQARAEKAGVQPPGYSAHNFGLAIDVHTDAMLAATKLTKPQFDDHMRQFGWFCHRKDGKRGMEDWHYNFLGVEQSATFLMASVKSTNTSAAVEAKMLALYADGIKLDPFEVQECLAQMKMYGGEIDGQLGPRSKQAIMVFQRAWKLPATGEVDPKTERTLAIVSAAKQIVDVQQAA